MPKFSSQINKTINKNLIFAFQNAKILKLRPQQMYHTVEPKELDVQVLHQDSCHKKLTINLKA